MNILLIFFALPIATIIISIALQRILKCPPLVAAIIFAIFLIVTFIINNLNFLVAAIVYAIISFITAVIIHIICRFFNREDCENSCRRCNCREDRDDSCCSCNCRDNRRRDNRRSRNELLTINSSCQNNGNGELLTISSSGCNGTENDLLTINSNTSNSNCDRNCNWQTINSNGVTARISIIPNNNSNDNSSCSCGNCRRR